MRVSRVSEEEEEEEEDGGGAAVELEAVWPQPPRASMAAPVTFLATSQQK